jgi:hypothetical protein
MNKDFDFRERFDAANEAMKDILAEALKDFEYAYPLQFRIRKRVLKHIHEAPAREAKALRNGPR